MGTTTNKSFRWPTPTVGVKPNVAQDIRNLAEDLDTAVSGATNLGTGTDLNALMAGGSYTGSAFTNAPEGYNGGFNIFVMGNWSSRYGGQIAVRNDAGTPIWYYRSLVAATWSTWSKFGGGSPADIGGTDLNALNSSGSYQGGGLGNAPGGLTNTFFVNVVYRDANTIVQNATSLSTGDQWHRYKAGTWSAWARNIDTRADTGWLLSPLASASGWSAKTDPDGNTSGTITGGVRAVGQFVEYRFRVTRTGGNLTADSTGNLADTTLATVSPTAWPNLVPSTAVYDNFFVVGVRQGSIRFDQTGTFQITDLYPADTISTGDVIQISVRFLAG